MLQKIKAPVKNLVTGFIIGLSMLVPGVSGGTMAIVLGIYDRLVTAVSRFFGDWKRNLLFLGAVAVGGLLGFWLGSKPMLWLLERFEVPMMFFFIGATLGSVPLLVRKTGAKVSASSVIWAAVGFAIVLSTVLLRNLPQSLAYTEGSFGGMVYLFLAGIPLAIAFVLPGISFSYMLVILSLYKQFLSALESLNFAFLLPLGCGGVVGVLLTIRLLELAMTKKPKQTFSCITGFVLGSVPVILTSLPHMPAGWEIAACALMLAAGALAIYFYSKRDR